MRTTRVVPLNPLPHGPSGLVEAPKAALPDAFFLEAAKEALNETVLLRRVGRDVFLLQPVIPAGLPETTTLKDQAIVAS